MATANSTCVCGSPIEQSSGRGRPRKYCLTCRPANLYRAYAPKPRQIKECAECSTAFIGRAIDKYCTPLCRYRANYETADRVPCTICGEPTGWKTGRVEQATHNACTRAAWEHGTHKGYVTMKCKCTECRAWSKRTTREYRDRRKAEGRPVNPFGNSGPWINPTVRRAVYERDNWTCQLCGEPVERDAPPNSDWYPSLDHITPQSMGGQHTADNLRTCHRWCNCVRGARDYHSDLFELASST